MIKTNLQILKNLLLLILAIFTTSASAEDSLLQDMGSWLQLIGEGSLKVIDPHLDKGRIWLEGQSRFL